MSQRMTRATLGRWPAGRSAPGAPRPPRCLPSPKPALRLASRPPRGASVSSSSRPALAAWLPATCMSLPASNVPAACAAEGHTKLEVYIRTAVVHYKKPLDRPFFSVSVRGAAQASGARIRICAEDGGLCRCVGCHSLSGHWEDCCCARWKAARPSAQSPAPPNAPRSVLAGPAPPGSAGTRFAGSAGGAAARHSPGVVPPRDGRHHRQRNRRVADAAGAGPAG
jgi:hypothetical protein